jgi:maltose O-acetyltransferase
MTEKEKMIAGEMYDPMDQELKRDREKAHELCYTYNQLAPSEKSKKKEILKELFNTEKNCYIEPNFRCDYGYNISFGKNFYMNFDCVILDVNKVTFGDNVMIAPKVQIYTATHPLNPDRRNSGRELGYPIDIGDNVWIGGNSIIFPDVTIGDNVTTGAGSVVTKNIPDNVLALGNPCRVIKEL